MRNKSKQTICGIVSLILFSCYVLSSEVFVLSFDGIGNIEIELLGDTVSPQQIPAKDNQQIPHNHITLGHLFSIEDSEAEISLIPASTTAGIQPQKLFTNFSRNLPNAYLLLSHRKLPHQILSKLSSTIILV